LGESGRTVFSGTEIILDMEDEIIQIITTSKAPTFKSFQN